MRGILGPLGREEGVAPNIEDLICDGPSYISMLPRGKTSIRAMEAAAKTLSAARFMTPRVTDRMTE